MTRVLAEIESQPELWSCSAALAAERRELLPQPAQRVAFFGCGTSLYVAEAVAAAREAAGQGESDAFAASEMPLGRRYDLAVAISRSGTTTEVLGLVDRLRRSVPVLALTADAQGPLARAADRTLALPFADEEAVVQTRFATCVVALLRAAIGHDLTTAVNDARRALGEEMPGWCADVSQLVFLGRGWSVGLAREAALKVREAAQAWSEAYPAMEYRHGPISVAHERTVVWSLAELPRGLSDEIGQTGATLVRPAGDPLAELVRIQRVAVAMAQARGLDPDRPAHLTRSVVLSGDAVEH